MSLYLSLHLLHKRSLTFGTEAVAPLKPRLQQVVRPLAATIGDSASKTQGGHTTAAQFFMTFPLSSFYKVYQPKTHAKAERKELKLLQGRTDVLLYINLALSLKCSICAVVSLTPCNPLTTIS